MKKKLLTTLSVVCITWLSMAQTAVLPTSWNFATTTLPTGWVSSGSGFAYYAASGNPAPAAKLTTTADALTISFNSTPGLITYDLAGNPPPGGTWAGNFVLEESVTGSSYTTVGTAYTTLPTSYTTYTATLNAASRYARFRFATHTTGNVGLDNVAIAKGVSTAQEINVKQGSTTIVNSGTYSFSSAVSTLSTLTLTVENLGTVTALQVSNAIISGPAASDYTITTATPFTVAAASNTSLNIDFTPSAAGTRDAILTITNDDVNSNPYIINLNGIGGNLATEPGAQPTTMTFPIVKSYKISAAFTAASPTTDGYLVLRRKGSAITDVPVDGTIYQRGDMIGSSKVVYSSTATSFTPNDIIANTQYYFSVFAYNGTGTYRNYLTTAPLTGNITSAGTMQPTNYYSTIATTNATFITDLHLITNPHTLQLYGNYGPLMAATIYTRDTTANQRVITCVYSGENKVYTEPFDWTANNFSREHTYCQSWQPTVNDPSFQNRPEYSDYHMITPTNQNQVNAVRSNNPYGIVVGTPISTYLGGKLGYNAQGKKVYEPRDSDKGDAARCMFYQCVTYTGVAYTGPVNTNVVYGGSWSLPNYISNTNPYGQDQNILKTWNDQDPPDNFEIARNDYVDSLQGNRNPFIDHPEYVCYIDFVTMTMIAAPNVPCNAEVLGISDAQKNNDQMQITPNPNNGNFVVNYTSAKNQKVSVKLIDMLGQVVYTNELKVISGINPIEISVQNLKKGIYLFEYVTEKGKQTEKLIIE